jgi:hypothetical protein
MNLNPSDSHYYEANHLIAYLKAHSTLAIEYSAEGFDTTKGLQENALQAASDASFADELATRYSSQGYVIKLFNGPIAWQANRQSTVTTSTTEAELLSLSNVAKEIIALLRLFKHLDFSPGEKLTSVACDNKQTVGLVNKSTPLLTTKLRHVDIHQFWLRQEVQAGTLAVHWIPTTAMSADGMTKLLPKDQHRKFIQLLGLVDVKNLIDKY